jgi:Na+/proline symporter
MEILDWFGLSALVVALLAAGAWRSRRPEDYLLAGRRVGFLPLVATLVMTEFNTSTLLAFSAIGYRAGPMAIGLPLVFLVGLAWYTLTVARPWKRFNRLSVAEFFSERYGPGLGRLASALLLAAMLGFSATYVKSLALIFAPWAQRLGLDPWGTSLILTGLVLVMTISGGLVSVVRTDLLSFLVTLVILPGLLIIALRRHGSYSALGAAFPADQLRFDPISQWDHPSLPFWFVSSLVVLTCFTYICSPWYGQKIFAARSERVAFLGVAATSVIVFLLYATVLSASAFFRLEQPGLADDQTVVPRMIDAWLPSPARGIAYGVLFMAAMTTLAGVWSAMVAMLVADFAPERLAGIRAQRLATVALAVLAWLGASLLVDDILDRLILANIPIAALSFALLAGFRWRRASRAGAWASVASGMAWGIGCFLWFGESGGYTWYWAIYGIPLIFAVGVVGSIARPDPRPVGSSTEPDARGHRSPGPPTSTFPDRLMNPALDPVRAGRS